MPIRTSLAVARRRPRSAARSVTAVALGILFSLAMAPFYVLFVLAVLLALHTAVGAPLPVLAVKIIAGAIAIPAALAGGVRVGLDLALPSVQDVRAAIDDENERQQQRRIAVEPGSAVGGVSLGPAARAPDRAGALAAVPSDGQSMSS